MGKDIIPELPTSPNIIIHNKFNKSVKVLADELLEKIKENLKWKIKKKI